MDKLEFVAEFLLKNESMDDEQFKAAMEMTNPTVESIEEIAARKKQKSEEENKTAHEENERAEEEARERARAEAEEAAKSAEADGKFPEDDFFDLFNQNGNDNNK
jgi:membrane protein involved in colicin uptake